MLTFVTSPLLLLESLLVLSELSLAFPPLTAFPGFLNGPLPLPTPNPLGRSLLTLLHLRLVPLLVFSFAFGVGGGRLALLSFLPFFSVVFYSILGTNLLFSGLASKSLMRFITPF